MNYILRIFLYGISKFKKINQIYIRKINILTYIRLHMNTCKRILLFCTSSLYCAISTCRRDFRKCTCTLDVACIRHCWLVPMFPWADVG